MKPAILLAILLVSAVFFIPSRAKVSSAQNQIQVTILEPKANQIFRADFGVKVEVSSLYELTGVTARIGEKDYPLKYNPCLTYIGRTCYSGYDGTIPTLSLGYGSYQMRISARDVFGTTGSAATTISINREPVVTIASPLQKAVAHPKVRLEATCTDDDPGPCGQMTISYGSTVLQSLPGPINTEISLAQFQGRSELLCVAVSDIAGQGRSCRQVSVETSPTLQEVMSRPGTILDVRDDRVLINEQDGPEGRSSTLRIYHRSTGAVRDIINNYPIEQLLYEPDAPCTYLTATGAILATTGPSRQLIQEWRDGRLRVIGQLAGRGICSVNGNYVSWYGTEREGTSSTPVGLILFDLNSGATTRIVNEASFWQFSTGRNGSVAYWFNDQVYRYANGQSVKLGSASGTSGVSASTPQTDGDGVVYKGAGGLTLWTPTGEQVISTTSPYTLNSRHYYYLIENGRVAFPRAGTNGGTQVWVRNIATGAETQQHFLLGDSYPDSLSAAGRITFIVTKSPQSTESRRYIPAGGKAIEVGSSLGRPFWVDERLYIAINGTLLLFSPDPGVSALSPAPTLADISPRSAIAGSAGLTISVTGTGFTTGSSVRWNGVNRPTSFVDGTRLTATINSADLASAGRAEVTVHVPESGGLVTPPAFFTIENNPRIVRAMSVGGQAGRTVSVPIEIEAAGNESAFGFSLIYNPGILRNPQVTLGSGVGGATLSVNQSAAALGQVGVLIGLPTGRSLAAGTRQLAIITFEISLSQVATTTTLAFGDQPIMRELVDQQARRISANFSGATIGIGQGLEGDVAPRPAGDGSVSATDWVQIGRMVAGIDTTAAGGEFLRADCAPRATLGDGVLTLGDWVQAGRYAAQLDPSTVAGGPLGVPTGQPETSPLAFEAATAPNLVRLLPINSTTWSVEIESTGQVNALAFSLRFDSRRWSFEKIESAPEANGMILQVNQLGAGNGSLGVMLAMPAGQAIQVGRRELLRLTLGARVANDYNSVRMNFADFPVRRELIGINTESLTADFSVLFAGLTASPVVAVSSADYRGAELPRGGIVSIFGQNLALTTQSASTQPLPVNLGGTRVEITDTNGLTLPAPLFYASPTQLNLLLPDSLATGVTTAVISRDDGTRSVATFELRETAPAIFTANGDGQGVAAGMIITVDQTGTQRPGGIVRFDQQQGRFVAHPIDLTREDEQVFLILFATGLRFRSGLTPVSIRLGSVILPASFAGPQGQYEGLDQVNVALPRSLRGTGEATLSLVVDGRESTKVRLTIK